MRGLAGDDLKSAALRGFRKTEEVQRGKTSARTRFAGEKHWTGRGRSPEAAVVVGVDRRRRKRRRDDEVQNRPEKFRNEAATWKLPELVVDVREDDGDVGYLPVPSAWTEELHGELPTATLLR